MAGEEAKAETGRRPWWRKKRWIALGLFAVWFVGNWFLPRFPVGPFTLYGDMTEAQRAARIPYVVLSSEATHPFRPYRFRFPSYDRAVARFPDARSCLVKSERDKPDPDIRLIDWYAIAGFSPPWQNVTDTAEVCLFRLFAGLTPETIAAWLEFQEFEVSPLQKHPYADIDPEYAYSMSGRFKNESRHSRLHWGILELYLIYFITRGEGIGISINKEYNLISVSYNLYTNK